MLSFLVSVHGFSQFGESFEDEKMAPMPDTVYYPFYNGIQMIEIDYTSRYKLIDLKYERMSQMPYGYYSRYIGNEYLFRNTAGEITQTYNISKENAAIIKRLRSVPFVNRTKHNLNGSRLYAAGNHRGYKVIFNCNIKEYNYYDSTQRSNLRKGLIDTLGSVVLPIEFEEVVIAHGHFLVQNKNGWGLVTSKQVPIIPIAYDSYRIEDQFIYFTDKQSNFKQAYHIPSGKSISLENYPQPLGQREGLFLIQKDKQEGVINIVSNKTIIPCEYEQLRYMRHNNDLVIKAYKDKKFGIFSQQGKIILPCIYDKIECCGNETFRVTLNGEKLEVKPKISVR